MRGATPASVSIKGPQGDFNPRSPCGERRLIRLYCGSRANISIHAPRAGSDSAYLRRDLMFVRISIHAPRAGSDFSGSTFTRSSSISIHAPRAGSDEKRVLLRGAPGDISIHAPRAGSDGITAVCKYYLCIFQSTLPVRGATISGRRMLPLDFYFNPRSPCGERRFGLRW